MSPTSFVFFTAFSSDSPARSKTFFFLGAEPSWSPPPERSGGNFLKLADLGKRTGVKLRALLFRRSKKKKSAFGRLFEESMMSYVL